MLYLKRLWGECWCCSVRGEVNETKNMQMKENVEFVLQLETENRMKEQTWLIDVLFWSSSWPAALLYITELRRRGHNKAAFTVRARNKTQWETAVGWHQPQYPRFMTEHTTSAAISGTDSASRPFTMSWLVGLGHIDLCMTSHDQTECLRPKLTTDNSYFYDNVAVSHQWAVICKKAEISGWSLYFCIFK